MPLPTQPRPSFRCNTFAQRILKPPCWLPAGGWKEAVISLGP